MRINKKYFRDIIRPVLHRFPDEGRTIKNVYWRIVSSTRRYTIKLKQHFSGWHRLDPDQIFWIDPKRIAYHTNVENGCSNFADRVFQQQSDKGKILSGDWDLSTFKFSDLEIFRAISDRIIKNTDWEQTDFFETMLKQIETGRIDWGCNDHKSIVERCEKIDRLIDSIKQYQVLSQSQLIERNIKCEYSSLQDEIYVNIGRNGQYLFQDGRHRLAAALSLGVQKIPVKVLVRHTLWQTLREQLLDMAEGERGASQSGSLYQPVLHPDLIDIPAAHTCEERWLSIKQTLTSNSGTVLDIGSNFGFFCHKLEMEGFDCTAVETSSEIADMADRIRIAEQLQFKVIKGDILAPEFFERCGRKKFDIVIALNIFHHFLKEKHTFHNFKLLLNNLCAKELFFEPHLYTEKQMTGAYRNFQEDEFLSFLSDNTGLSKWELIYVAQDGRKLYRLF